MIRIIKNFVRNRSLLFNLIFPIYVRLNSKRRAIWKVLRYRGIMLDPQSSSDAISRAILEEKPLAAGKIGSCELEALHYFFKKKINDKYLHDILLVVAGVFPFNPELVRRFQLFYLETLGKMTHIAVWGNFGEAETIKTHGSKAVLIDREALEPYKLIAPWTAALAHKRVVVVSPFSLSIRSQYEKADQIWKNKPVVLPKFHLRTVKVPFSPGIVDPEETDWFERLENIWAQIAAEDFDVCLIGAGALSLPLAVKCAEVGKIGIHLGGTTQILFGVWGRRWDNDSKAVAMKNSAWVSPLPEETPEKSFLQDNNSYW